MYMKLLEETIRELKGEDLEDDVRATVNLKVDFRLEESYVPDMNQRLMIYRRIAGARSEDEIGRIVDEVRDRYGPPPTAVLNLADFGRIRVLADSLGVETIDREGSTVAIKFRQKAKVDPMHLIASGARAGRSETDSAKHRKARPQVPGPRFRDHGREIVAAKGKRAAKGHGYRKYSESQRGGPPGPRPAKSRLDSQRPRF